MVEDRSSPGWCKLEFLVTYIENCQVKIVICYLGHQIDGKEGTDNHSFRYDRVVICGNIIMVHFRMQ